MVKPLPLDYDAWKITQGLTPLDVARMVNVNARRWRLIDDGTVWMTTEEHERLCGAMLLTRMEEIPSAEELLDCMVEQTIRIWK